MLSVVLLAGCATTPRGRQDLLTFLQDGTTLKQEVLLKLGQRSAMLDAAKLLAYRLAKDQGGSRMSS
jgi:hypothetical protein